MTELDFNELPELQRLALAFAPPAKRTTFAAMLLLDARCASIVAGASEPMLGQMRLAWWRDQLGKDVGERPQGDPLLDTLGASWLGEEGSLCMLLDGWENLLVAERLTLADVELSVAGRSAVFAAAARLADEVGSAESAAAAGQNFAAGDLMDKLSEAGERALVREAFRTRGRAAIILPRTLRPLAILGAFGKSALQRGRGPLFGNRLTPFILLRLGLFGR